MDRIIGFRYVWSDLVLYVAITRHRFWHYFSGCDLLRMLCSLRQFLHHSLHPLGKCNNLRDRGHPYKHPDLGPPNSPELSAIDYKIWIVTQQRVQNTKAECMKDLTQRLTDAWGVLKDSVIQDVIDHRRRRLQTLIQQQEDTMNIHYDKN